MAEVDSKARLVAHGVREVKIERLEKRLPARSAGDLLHDLAERRMVHHRLVFDRSQVSMNAPHWRRTGAQVQVASLLRDHRPQPAIDFSHGAPRRWCGPWRAPSWQAP